VLDYGESISCVRLSPSYARDRTLATGSADGKVSVCPPPPPPFTGEGGRRGAAAPHTPRRPAMTVGAPTRQELVRKDEGRAAALGRGEPGGVSILESVDIG
jgi:hypothetical protein